MTEDAAAQPDQNSAHDSEPVSDKADVPQGIFAGRFEVYRTVTEADYQAVLTSGLIVLDTSAMLDLYRYHSKTRADLIEVLRRLKGRVWVPNHAMYEFFERRLSVINNQAGELREALDNITSFGTALDGSMRKWANRVNLPQEQREDLLGHDLKEILASLENLVGKVTEIGDDRAFAHASDTARDPVIAALDDILVNCIGDPLSEGEAESVRGEARRRIEEKIPPGWKDADKKENQEGDYIVWHQTLREAGHRRLDVLFITSDLKEDWWLRARGETKGPLPALVHEMREIAGVRLYMLRPASLLEHAGAALGIEVSTESVQDAERVTRQDIATMSAVNASRLLHYEPYRLSPDTTPPGCWRYTSNGFDLGSVANLAQRAFSHPSHSHDYEHRLPAFRVGAFVACNALKGDDLTADFLRSHMRDTLNRSELMGFIARFMRFPMTSKWQSQPGHGRFNLEADLISSFAPDWPIASAMLLMPEEGMGGYGRNSGGAEFYMHVNLPMSTSADGSQIPVIASLTQWYEICITALWVPVILADFLEGIGLQLSEEPQPKFAVEVQGRSVNQLGIEEIIDFGNLESLAPRKRSSQFYGWAVADPAGKSAGALARRFLADLCESVGRTGYDEVLGRFPD